MAKAKATGKPKAAKSKSARKAAPSRTAAKPGTPWKDSSRRGGVVSQIEGRLGIALPMAEGDGPVQAYIDALPDWQAKLARRIDTIFTREVPGVRKAIKWHNPMYGVAGQGWFAGIGSFKHYLKVSFFRGSSLHPVPPRWNPRTALGRPPRGRHVGREAGGGVGEASVVAAGLLDDDVNLESPNVYIHD